MAVGVAGMIYRKPMMEAFNVVNLGGTQTGVEQGGAQALQKGTGMSAGAATGAVGAAMAGGGVGAVLGSMAGGAMSGRSGGSAVQAGRQGHEMGTRRGAKSIADRKRRRTQEQPGGPPYCRSCGKTMKLTSADPNAGTKCTNPDCPSNGGGGDGDGGGGTGQARRSPPRPVGGAPRPNGGTPVVTPPATPSTRVGPTPRPSVTPAPVVTPPVTPSTRVGPTPSAGGTLPTQPGSHDPQGLGHASETLQSVVDAQRHANPAGGGNTEPPSRPAR